ncbi:MAG: 23S rRNA (guanosine(2251)-2'-O)-methyltransferase RlmB [Ignavibacteria bacterium]|nr:23S rRNA (guanosine(2251)-2'-O)-methyltransferase RlmB [Ignavibacteria bacterium]
MRKIFGRKPVLEAILSNANIEVIYIAYGQHGDAINQIFSAAKKNRVKISQVSSQKFNQVCDADNSQGVVALLSSHYFIDSHTLVKESLKSRYPFLLLLDSIQDPHNLGAILRTAECAGVDGVIVTTSQSSPINETVEKISAGAVSHLKISKTSNLNNLIRTLKESGFWIVGSSLQNAKNYNEVDYKIPTAIVIGNEEKGIRRLIAENCDYLVKIPMKGKVDSLNASVATGILLFEINRQRSS